MVVFLFVVLDLVFSGGFLCLCLFIASRLERRERAAATNRALSTMVPAAPATAPSSNVLCAADALRAVAAAEALLREHQAQRHSPGL